MALHADVADGEAIRVAISAVMGRFGRIDAIHNNAGKDIWNRRIGTCPVNAFKSIWKRPGIDEATLYLASCFAA